MSGLPLRHNNGEQALNREFFTHVSYEVMQQATHFSRPCGKGKPEVDPERLVNEKPDLPKEDFLYCKISIEGAKLQQLKCDSSSRLV